MLAGMKAMINQKQTRFREELSRRVSKIEALVELFIYGDNYLSDFRGVRDIDGRLQAGAIISEQIGELYPYTQSTN